MAPSGLCILLGAGKVTGAGIARVFADPNQGNMAVALLARSAGPLEELATSLRSATPGAVLEAFPTDTSPDKLRKAFEAIKQHPGFEGLKLKVAVFSVKHSSKKPFMEETYEDFTSSLTTYVGGAMEFGQLALARFFADHGDEGLAAGTGKKGTLIFTGTLGAMRTNAQYASYGAGRAGVRMLAQALAKEFSEKGVHVAHVIANGGIEDAQGQAQEEGERISADSVGRTYLWLSRQTVDLWVHELDMRPACERF